MAELFVQGESLVGQLVDVDIPSPPSASSTAGANPKVTVRVPVSKEDKPETQTSTVDMVVDFGQITTVWVDDDYYYNIDDDAPSFDKTPLPPTAAVEATLDQLYRNCWNGHKSKSKANLTKKQIARTVQFWDDDDPETAATILRHLTKAGGISKCGRVVDSLMVLDQFSENNYCMSRRQAACLLAQDARKGGRFKRWPCQWISAAGSSSTPSDPRKGATEMTFLNGGWLSVDPSVRAGTEARKLVERAATTTTIKNKERPTLTVSDQRILRRLECLAMGEMLYNNNNNNNRDGGNGNYGNYQNYNPLEVDVREALRYLGFPSTPAGAKKALVQLEHWSSDTSQQNSFQQVLQPWSQSVLEAARRYAEQCAKQKIDDDDKRVDLSHLPSISVDAAKATFRDDALGLRPRAQTGRKVVPDASKWELLLHIADVSDLYVLSQQQKNDDIADPYLSVLADAAARRGASRYDLPLGPLHLLPPVALRALAFPEQQQHKVPQQRHRCVTLWAYIDERNGKLLDAGMERTLVSTPQRLSFAQATALLTPGKGNADHIDDPKARVLLSKLEVILDQWSEHRRRHSDAARQRESRLASRAQRHYESNTQQQQLRDDGSDGFVLSRGHRLVDTALDLHGYAALGLLRKHRAPIPRAAGTDKGGRVATAPLRRYVDGQAQRQLLAVLCGYGKPLTLDECQEAGKAATDARNAITNIRATKRK